MLWVNQLPNAAHSALLKHWNFLLTHGFTGESTVKLHEQKNNCQPFKFKMRTLTVSQMSNLRGSGLKMETLSLIFLEFFPHLCQKCCCWFKPEFGVPHFAQAGSEERLSNPVWFYLSGYLLCYLQLLHYVTFWFVLAALRLFLSVFRIKSISMFSESLSYATAVT